ncbi:MAG: hypothetical protein ACLFRG_13465 [Desulfococcaceae bacterium]
MSEETTRDYFEAITLNGKKGEPFVIKLKENPTVFVGVPIPDREDDEQFHLTVMEPPDCKGVVEARIDDIEFMKRP